MSHRTIIWLAALAIQIGAGPSARADDWSECKDEKAKADVAISACTRLITAGKTKGNDLAITYYNRAISYRQKNDNDRALADYNESIRINPKYA
jgi:tetratricopeptide (TPR) repeat protein